MTKKVQHFSQILTSAWPKIGWDRLWLVLEVAQETVKCTVCQSQCLIRVVESACRAGILPYVYSAGPCLTCPNLLQPIEARHCQTAGSTASYSEHQQGPSQRVPRRIYIRTTATVRPVMLLSGSTASPDQPLKPWMPQEP